MLGQEWVRHRRDPLVVERRSLAIAAGDRRDAAEDRAAGMVIERDDD